MTSKELKKAGHSPRNADRNKSENSNRLGDQAMNMLKRMGSIRKGSTHRKGRKKHVIIKAFNEKTKNDPSKVSQNPLKKKTGKKRRVL